MDVINVCTIYQEFERKSLFLYQWNRKHVSYVDVLKTTGIVFIMLTNVAPLTAAYAFVLC